MKEESFLDFVKKNTDILNNNMEDFIDKSTTNEIQNRQREIQKLLMMFIKLKCYYFYRKNKFYKYNETDEQDEFQVITRMIINKIDKQKTEEAWARRYLGNVHMTRHCHWRQFSSDYHSCRVCRNTHGIIRKYNIRMCRRCFRDQAESIGFHKYR
jgi:small subunit ribosomal protein S29e